MLTKNITYTDYNGCERNEDFNFNLTEAELVEMEMSISGGLSETIRKITVSRDQPTLFRIFKELILKAYGEKDPDGKRFIKSEELAIAFSQTEAYSKLVMELITNEDTISEFINGIVPNDVAKQITPDCSSVCKLTER